MIEVFFTVNFKNKNYQTNVIVNKEMTWEKIKQLAEEQVKKQWDF
ncbi:BA3454 family stress response protein [Peribacillus saganii]|uniref:BA3454 family stress response protein n=1 Tax=Peribacillus saganii TaxID=2303992 RepID=A0A372LRN2_9BACI|nr:BA3454 family stress response protein [Peribacillus saganii]RFU70577.1 BA3454 family stress response protein [Peribacillus saganii]